MEQRKEDFESIYEEEEQERCQTWERFLRNSSRGATAQAEVLRELHEEDINVRQYPKYGAEGDSSRRLSQQPMWKDLQPSILMFQQTYRQHARKNYISASANSQVQYCTQLPTTVEGGACDAHALQLTNADASATLKKSSQSASEDDLEDEFFDADRSETMSEASMENAALASDATSSDKIQVAEQSEERTDPWIEELQLLVHGGIPKTIRGEVWQVFAGTETRRVENHYDMFVGLSTDSESSRSSLPTRWPSRVRKDLSKLTSNHPASKLDEEGLRALGRILYAYVEYNPDVQYCQAIGKIAALLLLLMPEENAFWTLSAILDDYVPGYYSKNMREAEVDQLVFEDLMHEHFPRLTTHLSTIGVKLASITRRWFLHILIGALSWESVLRVWDVLFFEGNRCILFRTGLALFEIHAPAIMSSHDAEDVIQRVQSRASMTFDSSQLVLTACMGFSGIDEPKLCDLRMKYRSCVLANPLESSLGSRLWKGLRGAISQRVSINFSNYQLPVDGNSPKEINFLCPEEEGHNIKLLSKVDTLNGSSQINNVSDSYEDADVRRQVQNLRLEVGTLKKKLEEKEEQEQAMAQIIVRMEYENKITEDARRFAEEDARKFQDLYKEALDALSKMESRAKVAESHVLLMSCSDAPDDLLSAPDGSQHEQATTSLKSARSQSFSFPRKPVGSSSQSNGRASVCNFPKQMKTEERNSVIKNESGEPKQKVFSGASIKSWRLKAQGIAKDR